MEKKFLLILFYSASGSVKNLAHAIADGAENAGHIVKIRTVPKITSKIEKDTITQVFDLKKRISELEAKEHERDLNGTK